MSDDEYEYEYEYSDGSGNEDESDNGDDGSEFHYTDESEAEEDADDIEVQMENEYYNAKESRDTDKDEALEKFENVIRIETSADSEDGDGEGEKKPFGRWSFKALKQSMKLRLRFKEYEEARICYQRLLECIPGNEGVPPNAVEKGVNGMLERVSALLLQSTSSSSSQSNTSLSAGSNNPQNLAWYVYDSTLGLFNPQNGPCRNERLWFKTNLKYGQLLYENHETNKLESVIRDLLQSSSSSSTTLMEIYALQIQLYSRKKDNKKLRGIYSKAMAVQGGIPHPRTIALIQELGGKMHMTSREYESANTAFFQAFKSYDEAGDVARLRCLKYLVLASMLHASSINPFDSQEVGPYKDDPEIVAMTKLVDAFHSNDIEKFERILNRNEGRIMDDEFIREYLADLLRTIRMQVLQEVLRPYTRITIKAISKKLNGIPVNDVENLLVTAILDGKLDGRIDQVNGMLLKSSDSKSTSKGGSASGNTEMSGIEDPTSTSGTGNNSLIIDDGNNTIPTWGENSISVRTCSAMENLIDELESVTIAVTAANSKMTGNNLYSFLQP